MTEMNLGDGFSRRKQVQNEFQTWLRRLALAGKDEITFTTPELGDSEDKAIPGSLKKFTRNYTIGECEAKLDSLIKEDTQLAHRISLTNQVAKAIMTDIDGNSVELTIPELIVLKNDIAPKLSEIVDNIPRRAIGEEVIESDASSTNIKWRKIKTMISRTREVGKNGFQRDVDVVQGYQVKEVMDYGFPERYIFDRKDKIAAWETRLKEAINQANKTLLVDLDA